MLMLPLRFEMKVIISFVLLLTLVKSQSINRQNANVQPYKRCENPNKRIGTCVAIRDCQVLAHSDREFVEASACGGGFGKTPYVCCSSDTSFDASRIAAVVEETEQSNDYPANRGGVVPWFQRLLKGTLFTQSSQPVEDRTRLRPSVSLQRTLLPEPPTCGGEFIDNRIYGGSDANAYEFPWMAFLEYARTDSTQESICAGSLITARYVLTAAHCVVGDSIKLKGELVGVRLGLLDHTTNSIFSEDHQRWRIEDRIVHENYKQQKAPQHDIALLRLDSSVRYSKTIRPICLPSVLPPLNLKTNTKLTVSGWGATRTQSSSPIKQKVTVPLVDQKVCKQQYRTQGWSIEPTHLCAGGTANEDSCRGDSGAPLMHYRDGVWVLEGIVSFGRRCGLKDWPGVYTRISMYTDWINKKLRN